MNEAELSRLAEAFGAEIARWPAKEREAARTYLRAHPEAEAVLTRERPLDGLLRGGAAGPPSGDEVEALQRRILESLDPPRVVPWQGLVQRWRDWLVPALALPAAACLGFVAVEIWPALDPLPVAGSEPAGLLLALDQGLPTLGPLPERVPQ